MFLGIVFLLILAVLFWSGSLSWALVKANGLYWLSILLAFLVGAFFVAILVNETQPPLLYTWLGYYVIAGAYFSSMNQPDFVTLFASFFNPLVQPPTTFVIVSGLVAWLGLGLLGHKLRKYLPPVIEQTDHFNSQHDAEVQPPQSNGTTYLPATHYLVYFFAYLFYLNAILFILSRFFDRPM